MSPRPNIDHIRRPQLIAAAAEVIAERGLAATRIADVAERAGTSAPAVLYWFDSKEQLLAEALNSEEERFYDWIEERTEDDLPPSERLALLIDGSSTGGGWTLWLELWARALREPGVAETRVQQDRRWRRAISEIVRDGQRTGEFDTGADPDDVGAILGALLDGLAVQVTLADAEMPPRRMSSLARLVAEQSLGCELPAPGAAGSDAGIRDEAPLTRAVRAIDPADPGVVPA